MQSHPLPIAKSSACRLCCTHASSAQNSVVLLPPGFPATPPSEQLHVGVHVHASNATTACWALQVVQPLQAQAQVHWRLSGRISTRRVRSAWRARGFNDGSGLLSSKMQGGRQKPERVCGDKATSTALSVSMHTCRHRPCMQCIPVCRTAAASQCPSKSRSSDMSTSVLRGVTERQH
jgi:hypothetical protein